MLQASIVKKKHFGQLSRTASVLTLRSTQVKRRCVTKNIAAALTSRRVDASVVEVTVPASAVPDFYQSHLRIEDNEHYYLHKYNFLAVGSCNTQMHPHPLGLARVTFENCVVQVRPGHDLEQLIAFSRIGAVQLCNVSADGWISTSRTLLPGFIFLRWVSTMQQS
jgi:hypothetical protein